MHALRAERDAHCASVFVRASPISPACGACCVEYLELSIVSKYCALTHTTSLLYLEECFRSVRGSVPRPTSPGELPLLAEPRLARRRPLFTRIWVLIWRAGSRALQLWLLLPS